MPRDSSRQAPSVRHDARAVARAVVRSRHTVPRGVARRGPCAHGAGRAALHGHTRSCACQVRRLTPTGQWLRRPNPCLRAAAQDVWQEVLRCVSRWELLAQVAGGGMTDALIFAAPAESPTAAKRRPFFSMRSAKADAGAARPAAAPLSVRLRVN